MYARGSGLQAVRYNSAGIQSLRVSSRAVSPIVEPALLAHSVACLPTSFPLPSWLFCKAIARSKVSFALQDLGFGSRNGQGIEIACPILHFLANILSCFCPFPKTIIVKPRLQLGKLMPLLLLAGLALPNHFF